MTIATFNGNGTSGYNYQHVLMAGCSDTQTRNVTDNYNADYAFISAQRDIYTTPDEKQEQATLGNILLNKYVSLSDSQSIVSNALSTIKNISNVEQANQAKKILYTILEIVSIVQDNNIELYLIPNLHSFIIDDDNSILIEWIFNDFRIGFNIEDNIQESGWYLITNKKFGEISSSGFINDTNVVKILMWLITFVMINFEL